MAFTLARHTHRLTLRTARLVARRELAPRYLRLRFAGPELVGFDSPGADDHIRLFFPGEGETISAEWPIERWRAMPSREYTPRWWDAEAGVLEVEFFVHDGDGVASRFAATAPTGAVVGVAGPRGSTVFHGRPESWFLAGDETAACAIQRFVAQAGPHATGRVLLEVTDPDHTIPIDAPPSVDVSYVYRRDGGLAAALEASTAADRPPGDLFAFVAAEASIVKPGRRLLVDRWGLAPERAVVKGYWRAGDPTWHAPH